LWRREVHHNNEEIPMNNGFRLLAALLLAACAASAYAQAYPSKPIRLVVPYPPGGSNDVLSRIIAETMAPGLGQQVNIDNRGGAGGRIGAEHAAKSDADGYTILNVQSSFTTNIAIRSQMPYDAQKDFAYIGMMALGPMLVTVHPSMPLKTVGELLKLAKARPGELNYGTSGAGGINHMSTALFASMAGINIVHVPYKGIGPAMTDLIGGHVQLVITSFPSAFTHVKAGRLKALATAGAKRTAFAPEIPTVAESGVPGYSAQLWWGLAAPAKVPEAIINRLAAEMNKGLQSPKLKERFAREGAEPLIMTRDEFRTYVLAEIERWRKVARDSKIVP
jgi:tripartite-type tricarboxylate transporter receptor subunit TctC